MKPLIRFPSKQYPHLGRCAYCTATENLSKEHIIPLGLGGQLVLLASSCERCRQATSKVETFALQKYLSPLRSFLSLPSRKPSERPDGYKLTLSANGRRWTQKVPLHKHPGVIKFVMFDPPGRIAGRPPKQPTYNVRLVDAEIFPDKDARLRRLGADTAIDQVAVNALAIARMIAKIAHSYAVAKIGLDAFEMTYLNEVIRRGAEDWNYWVGGFDCGHDMSGSLMHD